MKGEEARKLYNDARQLLKHIIENRLLTAKGVAGIFPANAEGDDVLVFDPAESERQICRFSFLRNQQLKSEGIPNLCLADFVAPSGSGITDYIGGFVVTAGHGAEALVKKFEKENDDYNALMTKVLADRLAEAFAEWLHEHVRKTLWAYAPDEQLDIHGLLGEEYQGIRPAPGYPACPEHSEKEILFQLLNAQTLTGVTLTENYAMQPPAAVSGFYFAHPNSQYFNVGKIGSDQLEDYAQRKKLIMSEAERLLNANLNYK